MTPKEKAIKLVDRFIQTNGNSFFAKECALIVVENAVENIEAIDIKMINNNFKEALLLYWEAVKNEVERL